MSQRRQKSLHGIEKLAEEAHRAVHLLLALGATISEPAVADECNAQAESLGRALRRAGEQTGRSRRQKPCTS